MQFDWGTLALQAINFAVLVWLLQRFLYRPVLQMIDARRAAADAQKAEIGAAKARAQAALAAIETERKNILSERTAMLQDAAARAEEAAATRRHVAEGEAAALLDAARKTLAAEREQAFAEARHIAVDLGLDVARRLLKEVPMALRAEAWLQRVEQHIAGLAPEERQAIDLGLHEGATIRVVTAAALTEPVTAAFRTRLRTALGKPAEMIFDVEPSLIAGVELHFPHVILRLSWRDALAALRAEIEADDDAH